MSILLIIYKDPKTSNVNLKKTMPHPEFKPGIFGLAVKND
jgi:hypothetical protein